MLFKNANVLAVDCSQLIPRIDVRVNGANISAVDHGLTPMPDEVVLDVSGLTLMPGLIDCHVHVVDFSSDRDATSGHSAYYVAARAKEILSGMLDRGFTTVRDAGGADAGLARAVDEGYFRGPRVLVAGRCITPTGGHGDLRVGSSGSGTQPDHPLMGRIADGGPGVQRAVREELRGGATHIKIMISGGIDSPNDRVSDTQYSLEEITAAVAVAVDHQTYVMAHAYTPDSIARGLTAGVLSIEHGNFLDHDTLDQLVRAKAYLVPTLVVYAAMDPGKVSSRSGPADPFASVREMRAAGLTSLEMAWRSGARVAFGTDLSGAQHHLQSREFRLRDEVVPMPDVIRSATTTAAELIGMQGRLGVIQPGALADLLVLDGNPLVDVGVLSEPDSHLRLVVKAGQVQLERLHQPS